MEASHHSWSYSLNRTCVLLQCIRHNPGKPIRLQAHLRPPVTHPSQRTQSRIPIRAPQRRQILLAPLPEPQSQFLFDPNNVCAQLKIHNRRNDKRPRRSQTPMYRQLNDVAVLALFPSSRKYHLVASILTTPMAMQHPEPPPMITWIMT